jgi:murein DD-endopeptidase MepM/ murein hydrolase activator NlpD
MFVASKEDGLRGAPRTPAGVNMQNSISLGPRNPIGVLDTATDRLAGRVRSAQDPTSERAREGGAAAEEFESLFIAYLLKTMRETIEESGDTEGGFGKSIYTELFDQELSKAVAHRGALGISDLIDKSLSRTPNPSSQEETAIPDFRLPISAPVTSGFGVRADPFTGKARFHKGVDLGAPAGTSVPAPLAGKVLSAGNASDYGLCVVVEHAGGLKTRYAHLGSIRVVPGDSIAAGEIIGSVGNTGRSSGAHLHFEVLKDGKAVDPVTSGVAQSERGATRDADRARGGFGT